MPPQPSWYLGIAQARAFLARGPLAPGPQRRARLARANGQLALGVYYTSPTGETPPRQVLDLLTLSGDGRIAAITAFVGAELQPFGYRARCQPDIRDGHSDWVYFSARARRRS
jgi:RNA polymerase sigma-70 factor (ECF subfamily)